MREITVVAEVESIPKVTTFVDEELERLDCSPKANAQIDICLDEILANVALYAYDPGTGDVTVQLDFDEAERLLSITFIDSGIPFDPSNAPEPDTTSPLEDRPIGGLGLFMVKKMVASMNYRREEDHNVLVITKHI